MDLNGDKYNDLIIGERGKDYNKDGLPDTAQVYFFKRNNDGSLNSGIALKTKSGKPVAVTSNSAPVVVDWNDDGLLDIILSSEYSKDNGGAVVKLFLNNGTSTQYLFVDAVNMKTSDGKDISLYERTNICVADLNYDGKKDLILGDGIADYNGWQCNVYFFENIGTAKSPNLKLPVKLQKTDNKEIKIQYDLKPYITDWNGDGGLDLLLGHLEASSGIEIFIGEKPPINIKSNQERIRTVLHKGKMENGRYTFSVSLNKPENVSLTINSLDGKTLKSSNLGIFPVGISTINYMMNQYSTGCYLVKVMTDRKCIVPNELFLMK